MWRVVWQGIKWKQKTLRVSEGGGGTEAGGEIIPGLVTISEIKYSVREMTVFKGPGS